MEQETSDTKLLLARYKTLMEESYNLRETDPAMSDYDFYEGIKLRRLLELQHRLKFKKKSLDLLN